MTLPTMNLGDDVQLTLRGKVTSFDGAGVEVIFDGNKHNCGTHFSLSEITAPTARVELLQPPVDPDVLALREILHVHQRSMTPPDSGWGDMSYLKGSYDALPGFREALACFKAAKAGGKA